MEEANHRADNPYTEIEGYKLYDASGSEVGRVEETVYDAPSDVLKYVVVEGHTVPAEDIEVDPGEECVRVPYTKEVIESAPKLEETSGAFEEVLREHYEGRG